MCVGFAPRMGANWSRSGLQQVVAGSREQELVIRCSTWFRSDGLDINSLQFSIAHSPRASQNWAEGRVWNIFSRKWCATGGSGESSRDGHPSSSLVEILLKHLFRWTEIKQRVCRTEKGELRGAGGDDGEKEGKDKEMEFRHGDGEPPDAQIHLLLAHTFSPLQHPAFTAINLIVAFGPTSPA